MKKLIAFIKETWHRLGLPSPTFFIILQWLTSAVAFVTGLPALLLKYQVQFGITFPHWVFTFSDKSVAVASVIGFIIAKLPVKSLDTIKLPFTNK